MVRNLAIASLIGSCVAVEEFSFVQQVVTVESSDYSEDCLNAGDYDEEYVDGEDPSEGKRGKGKGETTTIAPTDTPTDAPTPAPTDAPTLAPTDAPTLEPTAAGQCWAFNDMYAIDHRYTNTVVAGQLPYTGMIACQSTVYASKMYAARPLTNAVSNRWGGTCSHTSSGADTRWWVHLAETSIVESIQITNRADCCGSRLHNVDILVGGQLCANTAEIAQGATVRYQCPSPLTGDVVTLRSNSNTLPIHICGFQAFGKSVR